MILRPGPGPSPGVLGGRALSQGSDWETVASIPPDLGSALPAPAQQRAAASRTPLGSFRAFQSYLQHSSSLCDLGKSLYVSEPQVPWVESDTSLPSHLGHFSVFMRVWQLAHYLAQHLVSIREAGAALVTSGIPHKLLHPRREIANPTPSVNPKTNAKNVFVVSVIWLPTQLKNSLKVFHKMRRHLKMNQKIAVFSHTGKQL